MIEIKNRIIYYYADEVNVIAEVEQDRGYQFPRVRPKKFCQNLAGSWRFFHTKDTAYP